MGQERWYTPEEAAQVLDLTQRRVQQLCKAGLLGRREGGRYKISERDLRAFKRVHATIKPGPKPRVPRRAR